MDALQSFLSSGINKVVQATTTQLQKELYQLKLKVPSARFLISCSEWDMSGNKQLEALILQLSYATYDAEDLLREFEDQALRQKAEDACRSRGRGRAGQFISSSSNIFKHVYLHSNTRAKDAQYKLDSAMAEVKVMLQLMGLDRVEAVRGQFMPTTTETISAAEVFGRDTERDQLMEMLGVLSTIGREDELEQVRKQMVPPSGSKGKSPESEDPAGVDASTATRPAKRHKGDSSSSRAAVETTNFTSVLPIFGIGGMGKTTLAQLIYNDERVTAHFTLRIWVCVSDLFDIERMTKEIVRTVSPSFDLSCELGALQVHLMEKLKSQTFVLVLDDIWQITEQQWDFFYKPLKNGLEGSMILVTTRRDNVARLVATENCKPVQLKGLPDDIFWEFFKKCAFRKQCPESYPNLQVIGRSISSKLCGTPLAAKTLGRLLSRNLTEEHWITIDNSELWQQEQDKDDILPALRLSYLYLPPELRRCFAFCSIFPKDYSFRRQEIVNIWVTQGFVPSLRSKPLEDVGMGYLDDLRDMCLFQPDPLFPNDDDRYVMHDLIHDTAQYVSKHECFTMKDFCLVEHELRHMSVEVEGRFLSTMTNIPHLNKLRSLRIGSRLGIEIPWFNQLSNILFLSLRGCILKILPESICELSSLRYLDISISNVSEFPKRFWCLYSLQVLDATGSSMKTIHQDVTKLINLRQIELPDNAFAHLSKVRGLGNLSCLQKLSYFTIVKRKGSIGELKCMNELRGKLEIRQIHRVMNKEEAVEARLIDKKYIKELYLNWRGITTSSTSELRPVENEVMDGLRPNKRIGDLKIHGFWGDRLPSWFNPKDLQNLRNLELCQCYMEAFSIPYFTGGTGGDSTDQYASSSTKCSKDISFLAFTHLTSLKIINCWRLKNLDQFLSPKNLPSVKSILLYNCSNLESIPADFVGFVHLRDLELWFCESLVCPQSHEMVFPTSLQRLHISSCGQLDGSFPSCLENLTSLTFLWLGYCDNVESIPLDCIPCRNKLKFLFLERCRRLSYIGGSGVPSSINYVRVVDCDNLTHQVSQPFKKNAMSAEEYNEITAFVAHQRRLER